MNLPTTHIFTRISKIWTNRAQPEYARAFADLYWHTILLGAIVIIVGVSIYGTVLFAGVQSELRSDASQSSATSTPAISAAANINPVLLDSTIAAFAARQMQFQALEQAPPPTVADPSR